MGSSALSATEAHPVFQTSPHHVGRYGIHAEKEPDAVVRPAVDFIPWHPVVP